MPSDKTEFIQRTKQELNCKVTRTMLNFAKAQRGVEFEQRLADIMGLPVPYLRNENNWVSFDVYNRGCNFLIHELNDPKIMYKVGIFSFSNIDNFGAIAKMAVYMISPDSIFKRTAEIANQAVKFGQYRVVEIGNNRLVLEFKNAPGFPFYQHNCDYRLGTFAGIPQLFGLPVARHRSIQCMGNGDDRCLYEFTWQARTWQIFGFYARSGLFLGSAFGLIVSILNKFHFDHYSQAVALIALGLILYLLGVILDMKHTAQYNALIYSGKSDEIEEAITFANQKYQEAADTVVKLQAIIEGNAILQSKLIKTELIDIVLEIIKHNLGYDRAVVLFHDAATDRMARARAIGIKNQKEEKAVSEYEIEASSPASLQAKVYRTGESILVENANSVLLLPEKNTLPISESQSFAVLPFRIGNRIAGTITIDRITPGQSLDQEDVRILATLLNMLAVALENAELYHELESRVRERTNQLHESNQKLEQAYEELKQAQTRIVHSEKMASLGKLVAGIAHEMNNPAGILSGYVELMELHARRLRQDMQSFEQFSRSHPDIAQHLEHFRRNLDDILESVDPCKRSIGRIKSIIQDLRNFSRLDENQLVPADLNEGFDNALKFFRNQTGSRIAIETHFGVLPTITCYPGHLNQAFSNIVANAIEAISGPGKIVVKTTVDEANEHCDEAHARIEISDTGCGISPEHIGKVFDPFFTTKAVGAGKGLGLSMAYGIVKQHHGSISVESVEGGGTVVRLLIPVRQTVEQP